MKTALLIWATMAAAPAAFAREESQNWYGAPILPAQYETQDPPDEFRFPEAPGAREAPPAPEFPTFLSVVDMEEWRAKDRVRSLRELAGDAFFGIPLVIPQIILEEFLPTGIPIGPTTFLYRSGKDSRSLPLIVFDQAVFHESEFMAQAQMQGDAATANDGLTRSQRHVLRRSLMMGFRATYALPSASTELILDAANELGPWAYVVAPTAVGALLYLKGIDQKISIDDTIKMRLQIESGRHWLRAIDSAESRPAVSCEVRIADFPIALIVCMEMSDAGMTPQFIGVGTSLSAVEDLLTREENRNQRPND